ncbi:hypothetical protein OEIGOIKO_06938 [Streptomyces chrestomyceticus JCM 4735]|uniref:Uncharacterized protein n=1 Tax=Streptomyces chrestomyceticus JCM 4735 TaxID=1306181 RepID=A0A7U9L143_9ACTN|nr:hypothetical protein [Streptomyces chrestomyceticus]GCD39109.1 hypothetical protein OEIGOIKO_06938 [Streptomyces chrestomyceticus JCM 4735]
MSSGQKTATVFITVICALLLVIAGLSLQWPVWAWPTAAAVLIFSSALAFWLDSRRPAPGTWEYPAHPDLPVPPVERWERTVAGVALPSSVPDYDFLFSATIRWRPLNATVDAPRVNAGGLAVDAVLARARAVTARQNPHHSTLAQHQLDGALGTMEPDVTDRVEAMAENVTLQLSDADRERLTKLSTVRKDEDVWEHERNYERSKRTYLGNEVLKDTGSAVVWWMAKHDDRIEKTVDLIGPLAQLSSAANNQEVPELFRHLVARPDAPGEPVNGESVNGSTAPHGAYFSSFTAPDRQPFRDGERGPEEPDVPTVLGSFMDDAGLARDEYVRALFARRIADCLAAEGCEEAASAIRRRFDSPGTAGDECAEDSVEEAPGEAGGAGYGTSEDG